MPEQSAFPFLPILGIVGEVAGVASQILKRISGSAGADAAREFDQGLVKWEPQGEKIMVRNTTDGPLSVAFTLARPDQDLSVAYILPAKQSVDARNELDDASGGLVSIAPTDTTALLGAPSTGVRKAISFAIRALAVGFFVTIVRGVQVRVDKGTFTLKFLGKPPKFAQFTAEINDKNGTTMNVTGKVESTGGRGTSGEEFFFKIPPGLNIQTIVNLNVSLELDEQTFNSLPTSAAS